MTDVTIKEDGVEITIKVDDVGLDKLLPLFEQALRGAGYVFKGQLDFVEEE